MSSSSHAPGSSQDDLKTDPAMADGEASTDKPGLKNALLVVALVLYTAGAFTGITWGLPTRDMDHYLFGGTGPWTGDTLAGLSGAEGRFSDRLGADVDVDPLSQAADYPIELNATEAQTAGIYLRYRLYTFQPDEMITLQALSGMRPGQLNLDPRLYQYGGLFIYPIGAIIKACNVLGLIDLRTDLTFYLDNPDEFGKFYVAARSYAAVWGWIGVILVFAITRRLLPDAPIAPGIAALFFAVMPVTMCMAHEGKPHLPGAVLMLAAVWFALRQYSGSTSERRFPNRDFWLMCACCGAAFGMVLSSLPIFVLIPLTAWLCRTPAENGPTSQPPAAMNLAGARQTSVTSLAGIAVGILVYLVTNPYIVINALTNRDVLKSNFGNSLAMYEIARVVEGIARVAVLTLEGTAWPVALLGLIGLIAVMVYRRHRWWLLAIPAGVFFAQFVMIGAGKPGEYGRFGIFPNAALAMAAACVLDRICLRWGQRMGLVATMALVLITGAFGMNYVAGFRADATGSGSRHQAMEYLSDLDKNSSIKPRAGWQLRTLADPAPYCLPSVDYSRTPTLKIDKAHAHSLPEDTTLVMARDHPHPIPSWTSYYEAVLFPRNLRRDANSPFAAVPPWVDHLFPLTRATPISWANKPFWVVHTAAPSSAGGS
ncbi:MAG: glycosyltransferase family 39 protein [Planctomycetota bacterium]|jgi:hypothetical protein